MIEICCGSYEDALQSYIGGATRIELNSALHLGGLTPSIASLVLTKQNTQLEVICMVRCRGAGFCYEENEYVQMFLEAKDLLEAGADGLAFGFLNEDYTVNIEKTSMMVQLIQQYGKTAVFHRAIDCTKDINKEIETLIELGIHRILTSGKQAKAIEAVELITVLQETYGDKVEILPGSGINYENGCAFIEQTKVTQIHSSCKDWKIDLTSHYQEVDFSYQGENKYEVVSLQYVRNLLENIK